MKIRWLFLFALLTLSLLPASAQIEVICQPIHNAFLIGEESTVRLEVRNNTGGPLVIAGTNRNAKLAFELTTETGAAVPTKGELPFAPSDVIRPGQEWIRAIDLQPFFDLRNTGRFKLRAFVEWDGNGYISAKSFFNIERGTEVAKQTVSTGTGKEKITVKYSLRTVAREEGEILFLCLENPDTQMRFAAANLGTLVRLYIPQMLRDSSGHMHILHQSAPNRFTHSDISVAGRLL
ncbi:MAG: hypothetical protein NTY53_15715, partial [Kiritimatiellaeota bacterium]|nr:hypothetical protein [Kiritimatiellota bacterium]